ncbi:BF3164 family lipoprotein [Bacteroides sp.]|uniref:BF3164 family lipoprotein n=1 Tax=Bacteroides sp. TaxID=29523 RepID=UPI0023C66033|nr:BF3164 family lipoprotein [Bacteroides sp.]MDE5709875.1 TolB-like 6-bladed beta-propeller domain-containing protein [Bacteroides sp.]MDE5759985.1 TolB-like 6-bladed beta-propeller domain-containing protein [Bacteroides sp.]MDE6214915.1 TolB-like 6-bladed beta-propeller domain-containing protein [Bacteroides sp.]
MNRLFLLLSTLLTGILLVSCNYRNKTDDTPIFCLEGTVIPADSLENSHFVIDVNADEIILEASKESFFVETYRLTTDSALLSRRYGKRGTGPEELIEAHRIFYHKPTQNMLLYSVNDRNAQIINLDTETIRPLHVFRQSTALWLEQAEYINDSTLISTCVIPNPKSRKRDWFKLLHLPTGKLTDIEGFWPEDGFDEPVMTKQWVYNSGAHIKKHPHRNRFLYGCGDEGFYAEIFDLEGNRVVNRKVILDQYPSYRPGKDGVSPEGEPDSQLKGFKVSVTSRHIYILRHRETHGDLRAKQLPDKFKGPGKSVSYSEEVFVFDWEGQLCHKLHLSPFVVNIVATEDDSTLYGITESEAYEPLIVKYRL